MTRDEAFADILQTAKRLEEHLPGATWYGFGSFFRLQTACSDIDVLIVCPTDDHATFVTSKTTCLCAEWPLHLLIMNKVEQAETDFVMAESCTLLYPAPFPNYEQRIGLHPGIHVDL